MALLLGGRQEQARAGYRWLQRHPGRRRLVGHLLRRARPSSTPPSTPTRSPTSRSACGSGGTSPATARSSHELWPTVRRALDLVVGMQAPGGEMCWSRDPEGRTDRDALLTGSSSMYQSLRCGIALAELVGEPQPEWELAAGQLQHAVAHHPEAFLDKSRFSMDWYYPVLGGCVRGEAGRALLAAPLGRVRRRRHRLPLRLRPPLGDRRRDRRAGAVAAVPRRRRGRPRAADRRAAPARGRRLVLDRARVRRGRPLAGRAVELDERRDGARGRRARGRPEPAAVPRRRPADRRAARDLRPGGLREPRPP